MKPSTYGSRTNSKAERVRKAWQTGMTNAQIAAELCLPIATVRWHNWAAHRKANKTKNTVTLTGYIKSDPETKVTVWNNGRVTLYVGEAWVMIPPRIRHKVRHLLNSAFDEVDAMGVPK